MTARAAGLMTIGGLLVAALTGCAHATVPNTTVETPAALAESDDTPTPAAEVSTTAAPLLEIPIETPDGYQAVLSVMNWSAPERVKALCDGSVPTGNVAIEQVSVTGIVDLKETAGLKWPRPFAFTVGSDIKTLVGERNPVTVTTCASPNGGMAANRDNNVVLAQGGTVGERPFEAVVSYMVDISPNSPDGDFSYNDPASTTYLSISGGYVPLGACQSLNANGFVTLYDDLPNGSICSFRRG